MATELNNTRDLEWDLNVPLVKEPGKSQDCQ